MRNNLARYLLLSQASFFVFIGICTALLPKFLFERNEGGLSNYGVRALTVGPYTLAFLLCSIFLVRAGRVAPGSANRFRQALFGLAILSLIVLVTTYPYKLNDTFNDIHILSAILIFCYEMIMGAWMALTLREDKYNILALAVQLAGFVLAFFTFIGITHLLFAAQLITSLAFAVILVRTGRSLDGQSSRGV